MGDSDSLATLLANTTTALSTLPLVFFSVGMVFIFTGAFMLVGERVSPKYISSTLPPFPSGDQLQSIIQSNVDESGEEAILINTATLEELDELPGIGIVRAQKIIQNRPYADYQDLLKRSEIADSILSPIQSRFRF